MGLKKTKQIRSMQTIAAFDLGIKNLAYCVAEFDSSGSLQHIRRWTNRNLLADGAESQTQTRCGCGGPASWCDKSSNTLWCKRCTNANKTAKTAANLPTDISSLRTWAHDTLQIPSADLRRMKKPELLAKIAETHLLPYKAKKAKGISLQSILTSLEICLTAEMDFLQHAHHIRIENQPAQFAPHMKSIQIMLFTLLDHRLRTEKGWVGKMEFANASTKTKGRGVVTGKGGKEKRARKQEGIARVGEILSRSISFFPFQEWFDAQEKRDDLADAFLMCCDGAVSTTKEK
jgi:hypothetical protein